MGVCGGEVGRNVCAHVIVVNSTLLWLYLLAGHYAFIESSNPRQPGDYAWLQSPALEPSAALCMSFWFNMYGEDTGYLNIWIRLTNETMNSAVKVWSTLGDRGQGWTSGRVGFASSLPIYVSD